MPTDHLTALLHAIAPYVLTVGAVSRGDMDGPLDLRYDQPDADLWRRLIEDSGAQLLEPRAGEWRGQRFRLMALPADVDVGVLQMRSWLADVHGATVWVVGQDACGGG